jgi:hypothetical protein
MKTLLILLFAILLVSCSPEEQVVTYKYEIGYLQPVAWQSVIPSINLHSNVTTYPPQNFHLVGDVDFTNLDNHYVGLGSIVSGELNSNNIPTLGVITNVTEESIFYIKITDLSGNIIQYQEIHCGIATYGTWELFYNVNTNILTNNPL